MGVDARNGVYFLYLNPGRTFRPVVINVYLVRKTMEIVLAYESRRVGVVCFQGGWTESQFFPVDGHIMCTLFLQDVFDFDLSSEDMTAINKLGERKIRMCNWKYRPGGGRIYEGETSAYPEK